MHWLGWVCVLEVGGEDEDNLDSEKGKLGVRSPGFQPSSIPSMLSPLGRAPPPLGPNCSVKCDGGWTDRGHEIKTLSQPGHSLSPNCPLSLTSPDWPQQTSDTILLPPPSVLSFPQGPDSSSPPHRGLGGQRYWSGLGRGPPSPQMTS